MATLLLADDSVTIQRVIELTFADEGVRVIAVGDGETAIARMDAERPDIVLADVGMPGVDGYQVATHAREMREPVPVLLLTGAFEPIDEERARETGCDGVLVKPFEPRQVIKAVRDVLAGTKPAGLWPQDMPRLEPGSRRAVATPFAPPASMAPMPAAPPPIPEVDIVPPVQAVAEVVPVSVIPSAPAQRALQPLAEPPADGAHVLSVPYAPEADSELAAALARLEFVGVPEIPPAPVPLDLQAPVSSSASSSPRIPAPPAPANQSLGTVFSALLAAERKSPDAPMPISASPALTEAAVEEVVQKVVRRMTDEMVRKVVLETAERLIREEIARIKA